MSDIDTTNDFWLGCRVDGVYSFALPMPRQMNRDQALRLAAWIVAMDMRFDDEPTFEQILAAVQRT